MSAIAWGGPLGGRIITQVYKLVCIISLYIFCISSSSSFSFAENEMSYSVLKDKSPSNEEPSIRALASLESLGIISSPLAAGSTSPLLEDETNNENINADTLLQPSAGVRQLMQLLRTLNSPTDPFVPPSAAAEPVVRFLKQCLDGLSERLQKLEGQEYEFDYTEFKKQGCIAFASIDLNGIKGIVSLFPASILVRLTLSVPHLSPFYYSMKQHPSITPISLSIHERNNEDIPPKGVFNDHEQCSSNKVGGRHDPGLACGPQGAEICAKHSIPPFHADTGKRLEGAAYACHPSLYALRPFVCNVGDLTGKFGLGVDASPSPLLVDLRLLASDLNADNPCNIGDNLLPLVISCHSTGRRLACAPLQVLGSSPPALISTLQQMILETSTALPDKPSVQELLAALKIVVELESRVKFIEAAAEGRPPPPPVIPVLPPTPPPITPPTPPTPPPITPPTPPTPPPITPPTPPPTPPPVTPPPVTPPTPPPTPTPTPTPPPVTPPPPSPPITPPTPPPPPPPPTPPPVTSTTTPPPPPTTTTSTGPTTTFSAIPGPPTLPDPVRPPGRPPRRKRRPVLPSTTTPPPTQPAPPPAPPRPTPQPVPRPPTDPRHPNPPNDPNPPPRKRRRRPWDPEEEGDDFNYTRRKTHSRLWMRRI